MGFNINLYKLYIKSLDYFLISWQIIIYLIEVWAKIYLSMNSLILMYENICSVILWLQLLKNSLHALYNMYQTFLKN